MSRNSDNSNAGSGIVSLIFGAAVLIGHFTTTEDLTIKPENMRHVFNLSPMNEFMIPPRVQVWDTQVTRSEQDGPVGRTFRNTRSMFDGKMWGTKGAMKQQLINAEAHGQVCDVTVRGVNETKNIVKIKKCYTIG